MKNFKVIQSFQFAENVTMEEGAVVTFTEEQAEKFAPFIEETTESAPVPAGETPAETPVAEETPAEETPAEEVPAAEETPAETPVAEETPEQA